MKKTWLFVVLTTLALFTAWAVNDDDEQVFVHYQGAVVATLPADTIDSVAVVSKRQLKFMDKKQNILLSRMITQVDSITINPEQFDVDLSTSKWEMSATRATSAESSWVNDNKLFAQEGNKADVAYISTQAGGNASQPNRVHSGSNLGVSNLNTNDALVFTVPVKLLAKGSTIDFMLSLTPFSGEAPKYWIFEYEDNGTWKAVDEDLKSATEDPSLKYSFYIKYFSSAHHTTFVQSFKTPKTLRNENLRMRCRVVGTYNNAGGTLTPNSNAYVVLVNAYYRSCYINTYQQIPVQDTLKIAYLGNSFTYYYGAAFMLKEIAQSQGHNIRMRASLKGAQHYDDHLTLELSKEVEKEADYDYAILQDYSGNPSIYYSDTINNAYVLNDAVNLINVFKQKSPNIKPILENTWSFAGSDGTYFGYGNFQQFDKDLQNGSILLSIKSNSWMSPIGVAFEKARAAGITALYHTDNKHPNRNGAYLKACVNYLMIYGKPFDKNVPDCLVNASTAQKLRSIAEEVVLPKIEKWRTPNRDMFVEVTDPGIEIPNQLDSIVKGEFGIKTAMQLLSFAAVWNAGGDISSYKNAAGEVCLLNDINLSGYTWTPIAECNSGSTINSSSSASLASAHPFNIVFNGNDHTISGMKLSITKSQTAGLFGIVKGGTVKNVKLDASCNMSVTNTTITNGAAYGLIAACLQDGKIINCHSAGTISQCTLNGSSMALLGGVTGFVYDTDASTLIQDCSFTGSISNVSSNVQDNSNCAACAGIAGFARSKTQGKYYTMKNCTNSGSITASFHRVAGIVASTSSGMHLDGCINYGTITNTMVNNAKGNRVGGVIGLASCTSTKYDDYMKACINYGTIISPATSNGLEVIGGLAAITRKVAVSNCESHCVVVAPTSVSSRGVFIGQVNDSGGTFSNNKVSGVLATGMSENGDYLNAIYLTPSNYGNYIGAIGEAYPNANYNTTNIIYGE